jgi:hypothetical protein
VFVGSKASLGRAAREQKLLALRVTHAPTGALAPIEFIPRV